jgi:hypothetical protein
MGVTGGPAEVTPSTDEGAAALADGIPITNAAHIKTAQSSCATETANRFGDPQDKYRRQSARGHAERNGIRGLIVCSVITAWRGDAVRTAPWHARVF